MLAANDDTSSVHGSTRSSVHRSSKFLVSKVGLGSSAVRHKSVPGRYQAGSIPGYTGHVQGRQAEDVFGATHTKAAELAAEAVLNRVPRPAFGTGYYPPPAPKGNSHGSTDPDFLTGRIDRGSFNTSVASVDEGGVHSSVRISGGSVPQCRTVSAYHNPNGHGTRAGATIPGYQGHIPGKYTGNVFAKRYAIANLEATEVRKLNHRNDIEWNTNWIVASEKDRCRAAPGASLANNLWKPPRTPQVHRGSDGPTGWTLHQPVPAHQTIRY